MERPISRVYQCLCNLRFIGACPQGAHAGVEKPVEKEKMKVAGYEELLGFRLLLAPPLLPAPDDRLGVKLAKTHEAAGQSAA